MFRRTLPAWMLGLALFCAGSPLHAQFFSESEEIGKEDEIETDRDSFTPATTTAGTNRLILETAYSFLDNRHTFETHSFPEFVARYGINDWFEFRLGWNYEIGGEGNSTSGAGLGGDFELETPELVEDHEISYGAKVAITRQDGWIPASSFIAQGYTPTGGPETASRIVTTYVFGWQVNGWQLDSAMRYGTESNEGDDGNLWAPSIVLKAPVGESWKVHAEYFGIFSSGLADDRSPQYFSPGAHYLVTPNLEIGFRVGWGLNDDAAKFFSNVGLGLRL